MAPFAEQQSKFNTLIQSLMGTLINLILKLVFVVDNDFNHLNKARTIR